MKPVENVVRIVKKFIKHQRTYCMAILKITKIYKNFVKIVEKSCKVRVSNIVKNVEKPEKNITEILKKYENRSKYCKIFKKSTQTTFLMTFMQIPIILRGSEQYS